METNETTAPVTPKKPGVPGVIAQAMFALLAIWEFVAAMRHLDEIERARFHMLLFAVFWVAAVVIGVIRSIEKNRHVQMSVALLAAIKIGEAVRQRRD